jgi:hypothetical protein
MLTDDQKHQLHISPDLLHNADMLDRVMISDEMWCFQYDPERTCHSMQWKTQNSPWLKKAHVLLAVQDHSCVFLDSSL